MLPIPEQQLLERSIATSADLASTDQVLIGAAVLYVQLLRAQRLFASGAEWSLELLQCCGAALDRYLQEHGLFTYVACRVGGFYSLEIRPVDTGHPGPERELVTLAFFRGVRVVHGQGDEPLIFREGDPGGFTLNSALEKGWGYVLDDALLLEGEEPDNPGAVSSQP